MLDAPGSICWLPGTDSLGARECFLAARVHFLGAIDCFIAAREPCLGARKHFLGARENLLCDMEDSWLAESIFLVPG